MALTIDLSGAVALVTGVSSGIGLGIARVLARSGCSVVGCGRRGEESEGARAFVEAVEGEGSTALYIPLDIAAEDAPSRLVDATVRELGPIDILVSNAGRNVFTGVEACTMDKWNECMNLDLRAHWLLAQAAKPHLHYRNDSQNHDDLAGPVLLFNSSNHAYYTIPGCFPYNVAKAGLNAIVQSLAIELGPDARAVGVAPGFIETPANAPWFESFPDPAEERRRTYALHPVGKLGTPEEIGGWCAFLASRYAAFTTGMTITIDGGRSALMQDGAREYA